MCEYFLRMVWNNHWCPYDLLIWPMVAYKMKDILTQLCRKQWTPRWKQSRIADTGHRCRTNAKHGVRVTDMMIVIPQLLIWDLNFEKKWFKICCLFLGTQLFTFERYFDFEMTTLNRSWEHKRGRTQGLVGHTTSNNLPKKIGNGGNIL